MATSGGEAGGVQQVTSPDGTITVGGSQAAITVEANTGTTAGTVAAGDDSRFGRIGGVSVSGTPSAGQIPVASGPTAAAWATPGGGGGAITSTDITDSTTTGRAVLTAATAAAARTAIGAGTSDLTLGATSSTAMPGDTAIPAAASTAPADLAAAAAAGSAATYARADHVHKLPTPADVGAVAASAGIVVVNHGSTAGTARPAAAVVYWIGTVAPTNAAAGDLGYGW